jgi:hypothetical protein
LLKKTGFKVEHEKQIYNYVQVKQHDIVLAEIFKDLITFALSSSNDISAKRDSNTLSEKSERENIGDSALC